jgi:hypothetical protein
MVNSVLTSLDYCLTRRAVPVFLLAIFWCWETWQPFFGRKEGRLRHAARNLAIAVANTVILAVAFGSVTVFVAQWIESHQYGLLHALDLAWPVRLAFGLVLLDGWTYVYLEDLCPRYLNSIPTDPYNGQPLRYRRLGDGVIIYTVGEDRIGDGGQRLHIMANGAPQDLGFQMWDPDRRRQASGKQ